MTNNLPEKVETVIDITSTHMHSAGHALATGRCTIQEYEAHIAEIIAMGLYELVELVGDASCMCISHKLFLSDDRPLMKYLERCYSMSRNFPPTP